MKNFLFFALGVLAVLCINATFEADITAHYMQVEKSVTVIEIPQPDGMTRKVVNEIYIDRIFRGTVSNEVIYATNEIDTGTAVIKMMPVDERRAH